MEEPNLTAAPEAANPEPMPAETIPEPAPAVDLKAAKKTFSRAGLALFAIAAIATALQSAVLLILKARGVSLEGWTLWLGTFAPLYLIAVPVGLLLFKKIPALKTDQTGLSFGRWLIYLLMCFPLMYVGNIVGTILSLVLSGGKAQNALYTFAFDDSPIKVVVIAVIAPIVEEFIFRKQIIDRTRRYGEKTAIVLSGLSFGLFHMNLYQFFYAFALGLLFAYVYTRTGKLRHTICLHVVINALGSVVAPLLMKNLDLDALQKAAGDPAALMKSVGGMMPGLAYFGLYVLLILGLSVAGFVLLLVRAKKVVLLPAPEELPKEKRVKTVYMNAGMLLFIILCLAATAVTLFAS
jgi:membrane protease YdiL (CAAX protease family)